MRGVVLVGGQGTRLRPLTLTTPKQMLPVGGRPMIEWVLEHLGAHGVDDVVLALGYRPEPFREAYPDGTCAGVRLRYAVEDRPLDTAGAIAFAARTVGIDDTFVVVNGDVLTDLDVGALVDLHRRRQAAGTIALTPVDDPSAFGVVATDASGRVTAFVEKPPPGKAPSNLINAGTYVLEPAVLDRIPTERRVSIERETFPALVDAGTLFAQAADAAWIDAGTPATYLRANLDRAAGGPDGVGVGAVGPGATVTLSVIGTGVTIGAGATIRSSLVFDGARIGAGATVSDSIVGWRSSVGVGAALRSVSVVGHDVDVPAGAALDGELLPASVP